MFYRHSLAHKADEEKKKKEVHRRVSREEKNKRSPFRRAMNLIARSTLGSRSSDLDEPPCVGGGRPAPEVRIDHQLRPQGDGRR